MAYLRVAVLQILLVARKTILGGKPWAQTTLRGKMIQNRILNVKSLAVP